MKKYFYVVLLILITLFAGISCASSSKNLIANATVENIESYGHAGLDLSIWDFRAMGFNMGDTVDIKFSNGYSLSDVPFYNGYYVAVGEPLLRAYPGQKKLAVCINYGNFSEVSGVKVGDTVRISINKKGARLETQLLHSLSASLNRKDFISDEAFANFREIKTQGTGSLKLFRSASVVNNEFNRAPYADKLAKQNSIKTMLAIGDTEADFVEMQKKYNVKSDYSKNLYKNNNIIFFGMNQNYTSAEFGQLLVSGLTQIADKEAPYLLFDTQGKDRVGFVSMLLEALMGASQKELLNDYMESYFNYYGITKEEEGERYNAIARNNFYPMLAVVKGSSFTLQEGARQYLLKNGMSQSQLEILENKLR